MFTGKDPVARFVIYNTTPLAAVPLLSTRSQPRPACAESLGSSRPARSPASSLHLAQLARAPRPDWPSRRRHHSQFNSSVIATSFVCYAFHAPVNPQPLPRPTAKRSPSGGEDWPAPPSPQQTTLPSGRRGACMQTTAADEGESFPVRHRQLTVFRYRPDRRH